jgi:ketosteroid isomerase-like protein
MKRVFLILVSVLLQVIPLQLFAEGYEQNRSAIYQQRQLSNQSIAERNTDALLSTLMPDYHVVTSANFQLSGHPAQREMITRVFKEYPDASYVRTLENLVISSSLEAAAESGSWVGKWTKGNEQIELHGSYFAKWRKIAGKWLLQAEIFVTL